MPASEARITDDSTLDGSDHSDNGSDNNGTLCVLHPRTNSPNQNGELDLYLRGSSSNSALVELPHQNDNCTEFRVVHAAYEQNGCIGRFIFKIESLTRQSSGFWTLQSTSNAGKGHSDRLTQNPIEIHPVNIDVIHLDWLSFSISPDPSRKSSFRVDGLSYGCKIEFLTPNSPALPVNLPTPAQWRQGAWLAPELAEIARSANLFTIVAKDPASFADPILYGVVQNNFFTASLRTEMKQSSRSLQLGVTPIEKARCFLAQSKKKFKNASNETSNSSVQSDDTTVPLDQAQAMEEIGSQDIETRSRGSSSIGDEQPA